MLAQSDPTLVEPVIEYDMSHAAIGCGLLRLLRAAWLQAPRVGARRRLACRTAMMQLLLVLALLLGSINAAFVPIGDGGGKKQTCPEDWTITGVDEWIQGETTLDAGALTMIFVFSQRYAPPACSTALCCG